MPKNSTLNSLFIIILVAFLSFVFGFLVFDQKIFPYSLLKNVFSDYSYYISDGKYASDKYWANELKKGGYIIHFRHAQREKWEDVTGFDAYELVTNTAAENSSFYRAVCLTDQGKEEARLIRKSFEIAKVKINEVISSPSCRARQTAILAFGNIDRISNSLLHRTAMMKDQHKEFSQVLRDVMLKAAIKTGSNVVLSGHAGTLSNNTDILFDKNEVTDIDERLETGFIIIGKYDNQLVAHYKFNSIKDFINATIEFPVN